MNTELAHINSKLNKDRN